MADINGWLAFSERKHYDFFQNMAGVRNENPLTVLVTIDDATILAHRDEPMTFWGPYFARVIDILNRKGAAAVGLDFLFTVSPELWLKKIGVSSDERSRTYDIPFRTQLGSGSVVLASITSSAGEGRIERLLPPFEYYALMPGYRNDIGIANLTYDSDGVVRNMTADFGFKTPPSLSFASALVLKYFQRTGDKEGLKSLIENVKNVRELPIGFIGPPGTVPRISFQKFFDPDAENSGEFDIVKDRIVIIVEENSGNQDIHQTPYSLDFPFLKPVMMNGAEVHANMAETLISGKYPKKINIYTRCAWAFIIMLMSSMLFNRLHPLAALLPFSVIVISVNYISFLCFSGRLMSGYVMLDTAGAEAGMLVCYAVFLGLKYSGAEAKRKNLRNIFGRYVSDDVVESLAETGQMPELGGKTAEITVLFSDIRNFTTMSEKLSPEETVEMLNCYFGRICSVILDSGGTVDKFIGDAVMAVFGAPVQVEDHAVRAVGTALKMAEIASEFDEWIRTRFEGRDLPDFRIGIGLYTGDALVGNIGSPRRIEYTAIGDTVNTASRIEGKTKELGWTVAAGASTVESVRKSGSELYGCFRPDDKRTVPLKGKQVMIDLYEAKAIPTMNEGMAGRSEDVVTAE